MDTLELRKHPDSLGLTGDEKRVMLENMTFLIKKKLGSGSRNSGDKVVCEIRHAWQDNKWLQAFHKNSGLCTPYSISLGFTTAFGTYTSDSGMLSSFEFIERPGSGTAV